MRFNLTMLSLLLLGLGVFVSTAQSQEEPPDVGPGQVTIKRGQGKNESGQQPSNTGQTKGSYREYRLRAGDLIRVHVHRMQELSIDSRISPNGNLYFPLIKRVRALGRTPLEVARVIQEGLKKKHLQQPEVAVMILEYAKLKVYIYGEVKNPKEIELKHNQALSLDQAIAVAGGLTKSAAERKIQIIRRNGSRKSKRIIDLIKLRRDENKDADTETFTLQPNDTIFVPSLGGIFILGKVNKPGFSTAEKVRTPSGNMVTASQAVALADGYAKDADPENAMILRTQVNTDKKQVIHINLLEVIEKGKLEKDIPLNSGDTLFIPEKSGIYVMGEVTKSGKYNTTSQNPLTVTKAIALAGGFKQYAKKSRVKVYRKGKIPLTINVSSILNNEQIERDIQLKPGDIVYVPETGL